MFRPARAYRLQCALLFGGIRNEQCFAALGGALLLAVLPAGCGQVEQLQQLAASGEQGEKVGEALKASPGADASVVVNMLNGELVQVMVVLEPGQVTGRTVGEVDAAVRAAIQQTFGRQPQ